MLTVTTKDNTQSALAQLEALAQGVTLKMAEVGAEVLRENLSAGGRSGTQYPGLPRRSSAPGEFSQEQRGVLKGMVQAGKTDDGAYFGLVPKNPDELEQALAQEYGAPRKSLVGRANVRRSAFSPQTHARMRGVKP